MERGVLKKNARFEKARASEERGIQCQGSTGGMWIKRSSRCLKLTPQRPLGNLGNVEYDAKVLLRGAAIKRSSDT